MNLYEYDHIIVAYSGGKDSTACLLYLLANGVYPGKIELWHHLIDGREGSTLMDWPVTEDYCRKIAAYFEIPIYYSWKSGGFETEMLRNNQRTAPTKFEFNGQGIIEIGVSGGTRGKLGTRERFPQVSPDLRVRWCTSYCKIDVMAAAIRNQKRFNGCKTLVVTGERAEESTSRARYKVFEPHRTDNRNGRTGRLVDHFRPIHSWRESQVWEIIKKYSINPHPAYWLGFGRLSCMFCIFASPNQFATLNKIAQNRLRVLIDYENRFGYTMKRKESLVKLIDRGTPYSTLIPTLVELSLADQYTGDITVRN